jgi:peptidoglycan/xylan/chitin deacetylase (PgdA/CDA1 family)
MRRCWSRVRGLHEDALILVYHRVTDLTFDPQWLCVPPLQFAEHLEVVRRDYDPVSLSHLGQRRKEKKVRRKSVVITFDDGYADNLLEAKPLLERWDVPATVFIATAQTESQSEFWWDELECLLLQPSEVPPRLSLTVEGRAYSWELGRVSHCQKPAEGWPKWTVSMPACPSPRHRVYRELARLLKGVRASVRETVLDDLARWANRPRGVRPTHRLLSVEQIVQLGKGDRIEVGAHTIHHPVLATLDAEDQYREIQGSKVRLEEILGYPVESFAYPFGTRSDYTATAVSAVKEAGFACACANFEGLVHQRSDLYQLPRFLVRDWDGDTFAERLRDWFQR